jgi:hypothetical protein
MQGEETLLVKETTMVFVPGKFDRRLPRVNFFISILQTLSALSIVRKCLTYALGMLLTILAPTVIAANYSENFSSGVASGWTAISGTWGVGSGVYRSTAIGPADITVYGGATWNTGFKYHVDVMNAYSNTGNLAGAVYNYQNSTNYYAVQFAALGGGASIIKVVNGVSTTVATGSYSGGGSGVWFGVDIIRTGTTTSVKVNGTNVFSNITQAEFGTGKIGLITSFTDGSFDNIAVTSGSTPYTGTAIVVPAIWEAENFDLGGEGIAYYDLTPGNAGGQYRLTEDVDIIVSSDTLGGGYVVNNFQTSEWLGYTINALTSDTYALDLRASTNFDYPNSAFHVEIDGVNVSGTVVLPNTGGWNNFQWVGKTTFSIAAGTHFLKIVSDQQYFNLNQIRVSRGLLFSSGFENASALNPPTQSNCWSTGCWQYMVGTDATTGFAWPPSIWGGNSGGFQLLADASVNAGSIGTYMFNQIRTVTGHTGSPTSALYSQISQSGCCGTGGQGGGVTQDPYIITPGGTTVAQQGDLYIRFWLMFQSNLASILSSPVTGSSRAVFEFKTGTGGGDNGDLRLFAELVNWYPQPNGPLQWFVGLDNVAGGFPNQRVTYWQTNTANTFPIPVEPAWLKFEVFWHRSSGADGRVWVAVNGQVIADHYGANIGVNNNPINRIFLSQLYTTSPYPVYQYVDDVEIWNSFPLDASPH